MAPFKPTRRGVLSLVGGIALASAAGTTSIRDDRPLDDAIRRRSLSDSGVRPQQSSVTRETETILEGTEYATDVHTIRAEADGPTAMVVGGIHGNEESGYLAANDVANWEIGAGTLVVLPEANSVAIERDTRFGDSGDLNRQFPTGEEPATELAQAIWEVVERYEPEQLLDLHRSAGIYGVDDEAVGQAIFYAPTEVETIGPAVDVTDFMNEEIITDATYDFQAVPMDFEMDPSGLLVGKAAADLDISSYLIEVTSKGVSLDTQVEWTTLMAEQFLTEPLRLDDPPDNVAPVARIATSPSDATDIVLGEGSTVGLDASGSSDEDGEVVAYEWDLDGDGTFETDGPSPEVSLDFCGELTVRLRVTDDGGETDTASVTFSTEE